MTWLNIEAAGAALPGMDNWHAARARLRGEPAAATTEPATAPIALLPPNERRRATPVVRLALRVAEEALAGTRRAPHTLASVFASSDGDTAVIGRICGALSAPLRQISPTDFHNSVHNAPAGYWAIATGSRQPSSAVAGHDGSFGAGLLEAALLCAAEQMPVMLVAYDAPHSPPMHAKRPLAAAAAVALLLAPENSSEPRLARLRLTPTLDPVSALADPDLEVLRTVNPAARGLPLLRALARGDTAVLVLPAGGALRLRVELQGA